MTDELPQRRSTPGLCTLHFADIRELRQPRSIGIGWT
jgi:hypothetical protein